MYRLTVRRKVQASEILNRYSAALNSTHHIDSMALERELRAKWDLGYQVLKDVMIDMLQFHPEYALLAAYYMEHINPTGVVSEFQRHLAQLYGVKWYYDDERESRRDSYWERAFALNVHFDIEREHAGGSLLQISRRVNAHLVEYCIRHPNHLRSMESRHFEELIAELFNGFGFNVELTQPTRDGGCDIIAIGGHQLVSNKYLIECKRYAEQNRVGVQPVRALHGVVAADRATKGILVTTSSFTADACVFLERHKWIIEGTAFDGVVNWLQEYQRIRGSR